MLAGENVAEMLLPSQALGTLSHAEESLLEKAYLCGYAVEAAKATDKVERLKIVTAGFIAGLMTPFHVTQAQPPIPVAVGSTLEAKMKNGTNLYFEHIGPKPTDSYVLAKGPDNSFTYYGATQVI